MLSILSNLPRPAVRAIIGVWRHRWLAIGVAWAIAVIGWVTIARIPDLYESRAQVYINTDTALDDTISDVGVRPNLEKGVRIIRRQLLSWDNMERLIYDTGRDVEIEGVVALQNEADRLSRAINIEQAEEGYFTFRYADRDPVVAQQVVAAVLDLFIEQNLLTATGDVTRAMQHLDRELAVRRRELDDIDADIAQFKSINADELAGARRKSRLLDTRIDELGRVEDQIALVDVRAQRLSNSLSETPRFASENNIDALKLELAKLQSQFTDNYPDIQRIKAQIEELEQNSENLPENAIYQEIERSLIYARDEIASLRARRTRLAEEVDQLTLDAAETPEVETQLLALERERERIENTYVQLAGERTEMDIYANLNRGGGAIDYTRFEAPQVAAAPIWPPRGLFVMAVVVIAMGAGGAITLMITLFDRSYVQPADLEASLGLPVLGSLSTAPIEELRMLRFTERVGLAAAVLGLLGGALVMSWWVEGGATDEELALAKSQIQLSSNIGNLR